jgi:aminocarboxymuconate-semialdehyde decarboxylase
MSIDTHAHAVIPEANALVGRSDGFKLELAGEQIAHSAESLEVNQAQIAALGEKLASPARRISEMDQMRIDRTIVGPMPLHHYWADEELAAQVSQIKNDGLAEHCAFNPSRLKPMGTIPFQHPDLAIAELDRIVTKLGFTSISVSTNINGKELTDPSFDKVWKRIHELEITTFIHPWGCSLGARLANYYLGNTVGQPTETAVALSHIIFSGMLDKYPGLKLLAAHGGGYLPTYIGRSDHAWSVRSDAHSCKELPSSYLKKMTFDSLVYSPAALRNLVEAVGEDNVTIGTDYPFDMGVTNPVDRLEAANFADSIREKIATTNAANLFDWAI